jgi:SpoVK/Ycf46/Vps4 family AAA+-type ATPase
VSPIGKLQHKMSSSAALPLCAPLPLPLLFTILTHLPDLYTCQHLLFFNQSFNNAAISLSKAKLINLKPAGQFAKLTNYHNAQINTIVYVIPSATIVQHDTILLHDELVSKLDLNRAAEYAVQLISPLPANPKLTISNKKSDKTSSNSDENKAQYPSIINLQCDIYSTQLGNSSVINSLLRRQFYNFPIFLRHSTFSTLKLFDTAIPIQFHTGQAGEYGQITAETQLSLNFQADFPLNSIENSRESIAQHLSASFPAEFNAIQRFFNETLLQTSKSMANLLHFTQDSSPILVISGAAGAGKSFLLNKTRELYQKQVHCIICNSFRLLNNENLANLSEEIRSKPNCVVFIDDFDIILKHSKPILSKFVKFMQELSSKSKRSDENRFAVLICVESAVQLRRHDPNFFSRVICIASLQFPQRCAILSFIFDQFGLNTPGFPEKIGEITAGFNANSLQMTVKSAVLEGKEGIEGFMKAVAECRPASATAAEANSAAIQFTTINDSINDGHPAVSMKWPGVGGYSALKSRLSLILHQWRNPSRVAQLGIKQISGILFTGPSGCGKTSFSRQFIANSGFNSISITAADCFSKFLGETERKLRVLFASAVKLAPCIIFIDELDSIAGARIGEREGNVTEQRLLATLLNELDGIEARTDKQLYIVACSNRSNAIDSALLRPGRFDEIIAMELPDLFSRREIVSELLATINVQNQPERRIDCSEIDVDLIALRTEGFTGAELGHLVNSAKLLRINEVVSGQNDEQPFKLLQSCILQALHQMSAIT